MSDLRADHTGIGSLIQVSAKGPQDETIHSEGTSFMLQSEYSRHTPFAILHDSVPNKSNVKLGQTSVFTIPKTSDMIYKIYLELTLPTIYDGLLESDTQYPAIYKNNLAFLLLDKVVVRADSETIIEYTGEYLYARYAMGGVSTAHKDALNTLLGIRGQDYHATYSPDNVFFADNGFGGSVAHSLYRKGHTLYIPLPLWDQHDTSQCFPCSPLYKQDLEVAVTFKPFNKLHIIDNESGDEVNVKLTVKQNGYVNISFADVDESHTVHFEKLNSDGVFVKSNPIPNDVVIPARLDIDYIQLAAEEKQTIVQNPQDFLYTCVQIQKEKLTSGANKVQLDFTLPVKQLFWYISHDEVLSNFNEGQFVRFENGRLILSNQDGGVLMSLMDDVYFSTIQHFHHSKGIPSSEKPLYSYSFAMIPQSGYNTGAIHFGKLPTRILELNGKMLKGKFLTVFALCYNVLDTQDGKSKVRFA